MNFPRSMIMLLLTFSISNVFAGNAEKDALKSLKSDIIELKKGLSNEDGNALLQEFNRFKSFENQNDYEINNYDEALFMFQAQTSAELQELIIFNFCVNGAQDTICLSDSELTREQLEYQVSSAIAYAIKDVGELSEAELNAFINSLSPRIKEKIVVLSTLEGTRTDRDIIGDESKSLQTLVNQLNDAASQQANIAAAILQQLSGILTLIFR